MANFDMGVADILPSSQSSELDEEEMNQMERSAIPANTSRATKSGINKFLEWSRKRDMSIDFMDVSADQLATTLRRFYAEVKKVDGKAVTPSYLNGIRAAIQRFCIGAPFHRNFNIVSGQEFKIANTMFKSKCKLYYKGNNPKPKHKPSIERVDMQKLATYFSNYHQNPVILMEAVWYLLCFHFGRRGREGWAEMKKDFFQVTNDENGNEIIEVRNTESIKNIQGGHKQAETRLP